MSVPDALARAVAVVAQLRGPGGCPWDREQTHDSLAKYAIEEAHEVAEAAETGDMEGLAEELGDLLLQVILHAQIAQEAGVFTIEDVAHTLVDKLRRRHPHVFAGARACTPAEVEQNWEAIKQQEKPRSHPLEGIGGNLPALMRAQKVLSRAESSRLPVPEPTLGRPSTTNESAPAKVTRETIGAELLATVRRAQAAKIDAEQALRSAVRDLEASFDPPFSR